jgi:hypothetical protein
MSLNKISLLCCLLLLLTACTPKVHNVGMLGYMDSLKAQSSSVSVEVIDERAEPTIHGKAIMESGGESSVRFQTDPMIAPLLARKLSSLDAIASSGFTRLVVRLQRIDLTSRLSSVGPHKSSAEIVVILDSYNKDILSSSITVKSISHNNSVSSSVISEIAKAIITDMIDDLSGKIASESGK